MIATAPALAARSLLFRAAGVVALLACVLTGSRVARADVVSQEQFALTLWQELSTYMVFESEEAMRKLEENYIAPAGGFNPKAIINEEFVREVEVAVQRAAEMGLIDPVRARGVVALVLQSHKEYDLIGALEEQTHLPAVYREAPVGKYPQIRKGQAQPVEIIR